MISKELFIKFLSQYQRFNIAFERIEEALMGKKYSSNLYESDWYDAVGYMLDIFLQSHFTEYGCDLVHAYLWEDCKEFWINKDKTLFEDSKEEHYTFNTLEELYDVMLKFKNEYFLNV
jgi:hypothetical protein